jgi:hypothetical protein
MWFPTSLQTAKHQPEHIMVEFSIAENRNGRWSRASLVLLGRSSLKFLAFPKLGHYIMPPVTTHNLKSL